MGKDYIAYEEYEGLCEAEGITDELSQRTLIGFLHDLGVVLNFQEDPRLEDTNILNPEWVTNGVYAILNDADLISQRRGLLQLKLLSRILKPKKYPRRKHLFIINMMRKFELCFSLDGVSEQTFLIPELLSKEEPETGEWDDALAFQYHYSVLPGSIISRFIVRAHALAYQQTWWRSGVMLEHQGNQALVMADREDKKMFIWVSGAPPTRRALLYSIRLTFESIHRTIPGLEVKEKVPLPEYPEIVVDYRHLLTLERNNRPDFIPEGLDQVVAVKPLLDGVDLDRTRRYRESDERDRPGFDQRQTLDIMEILQQLANRPIVIENRIERSFTPEQLIPDNPPSPKAPPLSRKRNFYLLCLGRRKRRHRQSNRAGFL